MSGMEVRTLGYRDGNHSCPPADRLRLPSPDCRPDKRIHDIVIALQRCLRRRRVDRRRATPSAPAPRARLCTASRFVKPPREINRRFTNRIVYDSTRTTSDGRASCYYVLILVERLAHETRYLALVAAYFSARLPVTLPILISRTRRSVEYVSH